MRSPGRLALEEGQSPLLPPSKCRAASRPLNLQAEPSGRFRPQTPSLGNLDQTIGAKSWRRSQRSTIPVVKPRSTGTGFRGDGSLSLARALAAQSRALSCLAPGSRQQRQRCPSKPSATSRTPRARLAAVPAPFSRRPVPAIMSMARSAPRDGACFIRKRAEPRPWQRNFARGARFKQTGLTTRLDQ